MVTQQISPNLYRSGPFAAARHQTGVLSMNNVVFRPSRQPRVTLPQPAESRSSGSLSQDPAIILIIALGISFVTLAMVTGWLLIQS